jgi:Holliday junction DNA helicase RuvB
MSASLSEDIGTIEDVLEPFLMQQGLIKRSSRGRYATLKAYKHFSKTPPDHIL